MNHLFRTTIKDLISRNKFFQCFVCYDQFNSSDKYPMQVCRNHHYMCQDCVKSRAFNAKAKNHYKCGLCMTPIKLSEIKRNPFILSIKEFFQSLIDRQEKSRERYKQYMENQQKIVEILIQENEQVVKESTKQQKQIQKLKEKVKNLEKKLQEKQLVQKLQKKQIHKEQQKFIVLPQDYQDQQFEKLVASKEMQNKLQKNSIFRSNLFDSTEKLAKQNDFVPNPAFSKIFYQSEPAPQLLMSKTVSILSKLIQQGKHIKENLINEQHQSKIKLKESLKQLQTHNKYINVIDENNEKKIPQEYQSSQNDLQFIYENIHNHGQPQKKVHIDPNNRNQKEQKQEKDKNHHSWFPFF